MSKDAKVTIPLKNTNGPVVVLFVVTMILLSENRVPTKSVFPS